MKLLKLKVTGFRSLNDAEIIFSDLIVLIGENDAGKSSILDLLDIFFNNRIPDFDDYHCDLEGNRAEKIEVYLDFELDENDAEVQPYAIENHLQLRKVYRYDEMNFELCRYGETFEDENLNKDFKSLGAEGQKQLIQSLDPNIPPSDISNDSKRTQWIEHHKQQASKKCEWVVEKGTWMKYLPRFERYSAMDYKTPSNLVTKTLKQVFEQAIFETVDANGQETRQLIPQLQEVQKLAQAQLSEKINELEEHIKRYNRRIVDFDYQPQFDFISSLRDGEFTVNTGRGLHPLSKIGDGTKRRMFLAVMDWDREVTLAQANEESNLPAIIRGYDEPDTNLHYEAQRVMYQTISDITQGEKSRVQTIICTHSLAMIDRAPAQIIRKLSLDDEGCTQIEKLDTKDDPAIENFLLELARELGITNSIIFYERCFVLIEGETEETALPILYKKRYNKSIVEDGIRVINVHGNGAASGFLRLLSNNRQKFTLVLLDKDTENNPAAKLKRSALKEAQFTDEFFANHMIYIGQMEFEDLFSNELIVKALQANWPKPEGEEWNPEEIDQLRGSSKFSDEIRKLVYSPHIEVGGEHWGKPEFGKTLAEICSADQITQAITDFFEKARKIAGIEPIQ